MPRGLASDDDSEYVEDKNVRKKLEESRKDINRVSERSVPIVQKDGGMGGPRKARSTFLFQKTFLKGKTVSRR